MECSCFASLCGRMWDPYGTVYRYRFRRLSPFVRGNQQRSVERACWGPHVCGRLSHLRFSIQDFSTTVDSTVGQPVFPILVDIFGDSGSISLMTLVTVCVWHAGLFSLTSHSRMMFGFARDGGLPHFFTRFDDRFCAPIRTICLAAFLAFFSPSPLSASR